MKNRNLRYQITFCVLVVVVWQILYEMEVFPKLMFPSVMKIGGAVVDGFVKDGLGGMVCYSLSLLLRGFALGMLLAFVLSGISILSKRFYAVYNMLVSMCDLVPGVALLPLAILWMGIGEETIVFIVVHSILWPMSRSIMDGFSSVPRLYTEVGRNIGLNRFTMLTGIYIPAAFGNILSGIKVGWARAWRGLISAEMIFGTTSAGTGIGWFIFTKRNNVDIAGVFAALLVIIGIGIIVEYGVFRFVEKHTIKKWGLRK